MLKKRISGAFALAVLFACLRPALASTPDWLRSLAQQPARHYADDVNAVVLLDDTQTVIKDNGEIITRGRVAFRILRPEGKDYAVYGRSSDNETKINYLHGWSITAKGLEYESKDKDAFESSASTYEVFSDIKKRILPVSGGEVGAVVGFEYEQKERPYLFFDRWDFQDRIPVEHARYSLQLPASWEFKASWENHAEVQPTVQNGTYTWELSDVPRIEKEISEPPYLALAGRMVVIFFSERTKSQTYKSWNDLGLWYGQLTADTRNATPALQQKVSELAPASLPLLERVRALSRFAQHDIRYAAIEMGIGGFKPHPAGEILTHRYGDCKDKATILSSMLAQIGVKSYYMLVYDERGIYKQNSPPYLGFNHEILAIQLPEGSYGKPMPAMYEHPRMGHLLIFDPTQDLVPFGELPYYEQDNYALLVTENGGELIHLPLSSPELNELTRKAKLKLLPDGALQGEIEEVRSGYQAMMERAYLRNETQKDRKKVIEHFLGANLSNFQVDSFDLVNTDDIDKDLILRFKFTADHYAKSAGPLLLVRPRIVGEKAGYFDATKPRHYAYEFPVPSLDSDSVEIALPDGFNVDEVPDPAKASFPFGEYTSKTETAGNTLKYTREYKLTMTLVPQDHFEQLSHFFSEIITDEKNMAVLKKAN